MTSRSTEAHEARNPLEALLAAQAKSETKLRAFLVTCTLDDRAFIRTYLTGRGIGASDDSGAGSTSSSPTQPSSAAGPTPPSAGGKEGKKKRGRRRSLIEIIGDVVLSPKKVEAKVELEAIEIQFADGSRIDIPMEMIAGKMRAEASAVLVKQIQLRKFADRFEIAGLFDVYLPNTTRPFSAPDESIKTVTGVLTSVNTPPVLVCRRRRLARDDPVEVAADAARKEDDITLRLAFHEAVHHVLAGHYPVNERDALSLAALHAYATGAACAAAPLSGSAELRDYFSVASIAASSLVGHGALLNAFRLACDSLVREIDALGHAAPRIKAKRTYLQLLKTRIPALYGATFFTGAVQLDAYGTLAKGDGATIAVSEEGVAILAGRDYGRETDYVTYSHGRVVRWGAVRSKNTLFVAIAAAEQGATASAKALRVSKADFQLGIKIDEAGASQRIAELLQEHCHAWAEAEAKRRASTQNKPRSARRASMSLSAIAEAAGDASSSASADGSHWEMRHDSTGVPLFVHIESDGTVSEQTKRPPASLLLPGWESVHDAEADEYFFFCAAEDRSIWEPPLAPSVRRA
jgi:hypothetical protein